MSERERIRVPIFPLEGAILFPRSHIPLHIFEDRYRDMVEDALAGPGRIAMIQPRDDGDPPSLYPVGCVGELVGVEELEDGRYNIMLQGSNRFRLVAEADAGTAYRQADVEIGLFDDSDPPPLPIAVRAEVEQEARRFGDSLGLTVDWEAVGQLDDEMLVNAISQVAPFDAGARQALLEAASLDERADMLVQLMQFQRLAPGGADIAQTRQ